MAKIGVCLFWKSVSMLSFCLGRSSKVCKEQSRSLGLRKGENFFCPDFPPSCKESSLIRCRMNRKRQQFLHTGIFHHCNKYRQCSHSGPPITCPWETWTGPHSVHSKLTFLPPEIILLKSHSKSNDSYECLRVRITHQTEKNCELTQIWETTCR